MSRNRFDVLEQYEPLFDAPEPSFDGFLSRRDRKRRNQRIAAGVVGIAVFVTAVWLVTTVGSTNRTMRPADEPSTVKPTDAAEDVVRGFLAAWGAFDPEAVMTYVADDANLRGLIDPQVPANKKGLSLMLALAEAVDYQETITWCNSTPLSSGTHVVCGYDFTTIDAVALGLGPFTGSTIAFVVRDGEIVNAGVTPNDDQYASQVRAPFAEWLAATYPRDFGVMYGSVPTRPAGFRHVHYRLTEESIRLFGLRTREYVKAVKQGTTQTEASPLTDWEDLGLPPEGAIPSSPETGELIAEDITPLGGGDVWVYADGRVIWSAEGLQERRLTPESVELVRSGAIQPGSLSFPALSGVPADGWADAEAVEYVPPWYAVCYTVESGKGNPPSNHGYEFPSTVLPFFPAPARTILRGEVSHGVVGGAVGNPVSPECSAVTIEEARVLAEIWADLDVADSEGDRITTWVYPILPHGPGFNSGG